MAVLVLSEIDAMLPATAETPYCVLRRCRYCKDDVAVDLVSGHEPRAFYEVAGREGVVVCQECVQRVWEEG
jgi:hypothetical protein